MQLTKQQIDYCMECGVCTGSCPISQERPEFSPRQMIKRTLVEVEGDILKSKDIWACLSCSRCSDRCPVGIDFPAFIRSYRQKAIEVANLPSESHHAFSRQLLPFSRENCSRTRQGGLRKLEKQWRRETTSFLSAVCLIMTLCSDISI